ncbi:Smr/MutS family protein [Sphingobium sp. B11D3A]|uniref:Smr/MutS family protein n=1 Tax=Sphingobium sp. B11D3A TaxID=2940574 RepID=UPI0022248C4E|nr:Smr/MutS family protein [Sphingobium sp. B11D3A]MCW2392901.1 DNA-nicking Smr family endonuclease [Sphingobium sp. B11D3A]
MARRVLTPDERALWGKLTRTVTPLRRVRPLPPVEPVSAAAFAAALDAPKPVKGRIPPSRPMAPPPSPPAPAAVPVLDGSWEKRIRSGRIIPDHAIDLHGLNLAAAHIRLERAIGDALAQGWRVLLVVTGKPRPAPAPGETRRRGAIRAEIGDWLARSTHAHRIASVRQAHPRHGGDGALYVILRRSN